MADPQQNTSISKSFKVKPKLQSKPRNPSKTPESKYWSSFKTTKIENLLSSIPSIEFSPNYPNPSSFAAANLTSLTFFSGQDFSKLSTISVSRDTVTSCSFRSDGALIAAADLTGEIKVFNTKTRAPLRRLRSHTRPVRFVKYPSLDKLHLVSGGDDAVVKYWDVSTESVVCNLQGHKDYVRSGDCSPIDGGSFLTGSYDHTVKLWDVKDGSNRKPVMEVNHGKPVEDVMFLPSGLMFATAGGNSVKIWDVTGGGRMVHSMESHNKTVTSICLGMIGKDGGEEARQYRILSVGLDGYMKVFDYAKMKVTHSTRYPAPLMSIAVSPDGKRRAIGTSNGMIFAGKKKVNKDEDGVVEGSEYGILKGLGSGGDEQEMRRRVLRPTNFRYFQRSQGEKANEGDYVVSRKKKVKLAEHDKLLKKFRHKEAFVSVLGSKDPENVVAVMEELVARRKLIKCVMNLEEEELGLLLSFLYRYATMPRHSQLLMGLTRKVLELRAQDIKGSDGLKLCIRNLKSSVDAEIRIQQSLQEMQGIISPLLRIAGRK